MHVAKDLASQRNEIIQKVVARIIIFCFSCLWSCHAYLYCGGGNQVLSQGWQSPHLQECIVYAPSWWYHSINLDVSLEVLVILEKTSALLEEPELLHHKWHYDQKLSLHPTYVIKVGVSQSITNQTTSAKSVHALRIGRGRPSLNHLAIVNSSNVMCMHGMNGLACWSQPLAPFPAKERIHALSVWWVLMMMLEMVNIYMHSLRSTQIWTKSIMDKNS